MRMRNLYKKSVLVLILLFAVGWQAMATESCGIVFNLHDSYGDGWNGNKLVVSDGNALNEELTFNNGSSASFTLIIAEGSHVTLSWIGGDYPEECTYTVRFENGYPIFEGESLIDSTYEFDLNCDDANTPVTITAISSDEEHGTVSGGGEFIYGETCTVTATPNEGYSFWCWMVDDRAVSTQANYTFTVAGPSDLTAVFRPVSNVNYIVFVDPNVEAVCLQQGWDTDEDRYLSYAEAAAVTDLGSAFDGNQDISSFNELQYFTGLTAIYYFNGCTNLTAITIPGSVTTIGEGAFWACASLTSVTIPNSVTTIGVNPFAGCTGLETITVETGNQVYDSRDNCNAIIETNTNTLIAGCKNTIIPDSVSSIGEFAFNSCTGLTSITIPSTVNSIGDGAFMDCSQITQVNFNAINCADADGAPFEGCSGTLVIGNNVQRIPAYMFDRANFTGTLSIPNSVTTIGVNPFAGCTGLETITVETGNQVYDSRDNCNAIIETGTNTLLVGCLNTTIPNTVTSIGLGAFVICSNLTTIHIPNSVTSIEDYAFGMCSALTTVNIPNSVISIGPNAFRECIGLTSIIIPSSVQNIGDQAFNTCEGLSMITVMAETPPTLGEGTFYAVDKSIPIYVLNGSLSAYQAADGWNEFTNFIGLAPGDITAIAEPAEAGMVTGAGYYEYQTCTLTATANEGYVFVRWTENGEEVSTEAVYTFPVVGDRSLVAHFVLTGNIAFADENVKALCVANWDADGDGEISYAEAALVTDLGGVFQNNMEITSFNELQYFTGLTSLVFEGDIWGTFYGCTDLTTVVIPNTVSFIGDDAFEECTSLESIIIPNSVTSIGGWAFGGTGLISITIPNSVQLIGGRIVGGCVNLEQIIVEEGNPAYDSRDNCNAIIETNTNKLIAGCKNTIIPGSVNSIGESAFDGCSDLTSITIPSSVTEIGDYAFVMTGLTSLTVMAATPPTLYYYVFEEVDKSIPVYVPYASLSAYEAADGWNEFTNYIGVASGDITAIAEPAEAGTVTGAGHYEYQTCTLTATANEGYVFVRWIENGEEVSTNAVYTFPVVGDRSLVAHFALMGNIAFADATVKTICVDPEIGWDTDGDGEISYAEAEMVTDLGNVFQGNEDITSFDELQYFTGLTSIGNQAFEGCENLNSIVLPEMLTSIGSYAFATSAPGVGSELTSITIPNMVTTIGDFAFAGLGLTSIIIPGSVSTIGENPFASCTGLETITIETGNQVYDSRDNCNAIIETGTNTLLVGCSNTTIPNTVTNIGMGAFAFCSNLATISIPNSVISIDQRAFFGCSNLTSIIIPSSVQNIGDQAFNTCEGLSMITVMAETPPTLGEGTFYAVDKSIPIYVLNGSLSAYQSADGWNEFTNFIGLASGDITAIAEPAEAGMVTGAGHYEYQTCTLTATANEGYVFVRWTENGEEVSTEAAYTFPVVGDRSLVAHFVLMGNIAFTDVNVKALCVSNWDTDGDGELSYVEAAVVTDLGGVFHGNEGITSFDELQYFTGLTSIRDYAFSGTSLTSITIPNSVTSIGEESFSGCANLSSVVIPNSVTAIGVWAFGECTSLTSIEIPSSVSLIGEGAFAICTGLEQITVEEGNPFYDSRGNCNAIIETGTNTLIAGCKNTTVPNSVIHIGEGAFAGCTSLTSMVIPGSVQSIGNNAFSDCSSLASFIVFNANVEMGDNVFNGVTIPENTFVAASASPVEGGGVFGLTLGSGSTQVFIGTLDEQNYSIGFVPNGSDQLSSDCKIVLAAKQNEGWQFVGWQLNGELVSDEALLVFRAFGEFGFEALFDPCGVEPEPELLSGRFSVSDCSTIGFARSNTIMSMSDLSDQSFVMSLGLVLGVGIPGLHFEIGENQWDRMTYDASALNGNSEAYEELLLTGVDILPSFMLKNNLDCWHIPTWREWDYMLNQRETASGIRFVYGIVNDVSGLIILPDDWEASTYYALSNVNEIGDYDNNVIDSETWTTILEPAGAVFLPANGYIVQGTLIQESSDGQAMGAYPGLLFSPNGDFMMGQIEGFPMTGPMTLLLDMLTTIGYAESINYTSNYGGTSLRLAKAIDNSTAMVALATNDAELGNVSGAGEFACQQECTVTATANDGNVFMYWLEDGVAISFDPVYSFKLFGDRNLTAVFAPVDEVCQMIIETTAPSNTSFQLEWFGMGLSMSFDDGTPPYHIPFGTTPESLDYLDIMLMMQSMQSGNTNTNYTHTINVIRGSNVSLDIMIPEDLINLMMTSGGSASELGLTFNVSYSDGETIIENATELPLSFLCNCEAITLFVDPEEGGEIIQEGELNIGESVTLTAVANEHYTFINWTFNGIEVSTDPTFSFEVMESGELVAHFELLNDIAIAVSSIPEEGGTVAGDGMYSYGSICTVTAVPNETYSFMYWTENGNVVSSDASYSFTVTGNRDLVANFSPPLTITAEVYPNEGGVVNGGGDYSYGSICTVTAVPNETYSFMYWTENGNVVSSDANYSFTVTENRYLVANFSLPLTVIVEINPNEGGVANGGGEYAYGSFCLLTAEPNEGYEFNYWTENGIIVSTAATYSFSVTHNCTLAANFSHPNNAGILSGMFSVGENERVNFSQGNLQYQASNRVWRFAANQYDYIGSDNSNISASYSGWIDLFGWGTSGYNHGAVCYQPWSTSTTNSDYYAYGSDTYNLFDQTGQADWGSNAINNGGNTANSSFRTLTYEEWQYILYSRNTVSGIRFAKARVNGVNGMILLPDDWKSSIYRLYNTNNDYSSCDSNVITAEIWSNTLEANGAVFLPAAGERYGTSIDDVGSYGFYWSASYQNSYYAWRLPFASRANTIPIRAMSRNYGQSVRLVSSLLSISASPNPEEGGTITGRLGEYVYGTECVLSATPNEGYAFSEWTENEETVSTESNYSFIVTNDRSLTAVFKPTYVIYAEANNPVYGFVSGEGTFVEGETCTLTATANEGYGFLAWTEDGVEVSTETVYSFTVTEERHLVAVFNTLFTITACANPIEGGHVSFVGGIDEITVHDRATTNYYVPLYGGWADAYLKCEMVYPAAELGYLTEADITSMKFYASQSNVSWGNANFQVFLAEVENEQISAFYGPGTIVYEGALSIVNGEMVVDFNFPYHYNGGNLLVGVYNTVTGSYVSSNWYGETVSGASVQGYNTNSLDAVSPTRRNFLPKTTFSFERSQAMTTFLSGANCTVAAQPNEGSDFVNWTENGVEVSTDAEYSFIVTNDRNLVANFYMNTFEITATATPAEGGTITGAGEFYYGAQCSLTATPNENYVFLYWTENGETVSTDATYSFTVTGDRNLMANFVRVYTITASANPAEGGTIGKDYYYDNEAFVTNVGNSGQIWWSVMFPAGTYSGDMLTKVSAYDIQAMTGTVTIYNDGDNAPTNPVGSRDVSFTGVNGFVDFVFDTPISIDPTKNVWVVFYNSGDATHPIACCNNTGDANGRWISSDGTTWDDLADYNLNYTFMVHASIVTSQYVMSYQEGETCTLMALPNEGYGLSEWTENGETASTDANYSFTVTGDRNLVAVFLPTHVITAEANNADYGTVTGGGTYVEGETCTLVATPAEGYEFINWTENGETVHTEAEYSFIVEGDRNLIANFSLKHYDITAEANPEEGGMVTGGGNYGHWSQCTLTATANFGYTFINWTLDGNVVSTEPSYTFTVTAAGNYTANFQLNNYVINASANPSEGGTVSGAGNYDHGTECTLTATANVGYTFVNWTLDGVEVGTDPTYTFTVYEEATYVANFSLNLYEITAIANPVEGGTITGAGNYYHGDECILKAIPIENYTFLYWTENGNYLSSDAIYSFVATSDRSLVAIFAGNEQTMSLSPGWTWLSSYIEMEGIDGLGMLENGLDPNGVMIKSQRDGFVSYAGGMWIGTLDGISNEKMYLVNTNEASDVTFTGPVANMMNHPITLNHNWTWIGYPSPFALDINDALANLNASEGDVVKTQSTFATYSTNDGWSGSLNQLTPGMGLMYQSHNSQPVTFNYGVGMSRALKANLTAEHNHWVPDIHAYPNNMSIMAVVELNGEELQDERYELAVFNGSECRGSARLVYVPSLRRYVAFLTVTGEDDVELYLALYDTRKGKAYYNTTDCPNFEANAVLGGLSMPFVARFGSATELYELDVPNIELYPNPVVAGHLFQMEMPAECQGARVSIVNALGAVISTIDVYDEPAIMRAPAVPGVYTVRIVTDKQGTFTRKLIVNK